MATLSKSQLDSLWAKFNSNPNSLNVNEYKSILDTAQKLFRDGSLSRSEAERMISSASKYAR